ncbi:leucyl aminopeptidase [Chloracidobacterium validum]|uniref:Probable cytosol aminopeptidase n=1 Tax=Chloracidobacterium validum TaxID=2821543 RepID=A0ABX8BDF0_9BACT|nr:leucyl aminopeptidase [Chloracidobacterium validum]QUW03105.1 leucyl aminopeptidase [Chloracidobacterium validum]
MNFETWTRDPRTVSADALAVFVFEEDSLTSPALSPFDEALPDLLSSVFGTEIRGKVGEVAVIHTPNGLSAKRLILIGAGPSAQFNARALRQRSAQAARVTVKKGLTTLAIALRGELEPAVAAAAAADGILTGLYDPALYRKPKDDVKTIETVTLCIAPSDEAAVRPGIDRGVILGEAVNFARTLAQEPSNKLTPLEMARRAQAMAEREGLTCSVFGRDQLTELGMGALLAVGQGSAQEPQLIRLSYRPAAEAAPGDIRLALVGKGITFDTGGICIKPRDAMWEMKYDMSGGAAVIGAMQAIARLKPPIAVDGYVAAAENMPSATSYKPGDVLHAYSGKTIEVIDTDAEGRLVLCDALAYARKDGGATHIVDLATLTGAVMVALGQERAGLMGTEPAFIESVAQAASAAGEKVWQLPLDEEYGELMKSDIADIKNLGNRYAGSITAAWFLREFVEDTPWVHLDIAGVAWLDGDKADLAKGPTGFGVRTIVQLAEQMAVGKSD